jgi:hypothetical protein
MHGIKLGLLNDDLLPVLVKCTFLDHSLCFEILGYMFKIFLTSFHFHVFYFMFLFQLCSKPSDVCWPAKGNPLQF